MGVSEVGPAAPVSTAADAAAHSVTMKALSRGIVLILKVLTQHHHARNFGAVKAAVAIPD
jgi:hypothetical protein